MSVQAGRLENRRFLKTKRFVIGNNKEQTMSYQVTVEPTGDVIEVEEGQTILAAALRQGVWLPFACGHGTCGTCKVQVLEGFGDVGNASSFALMGVVSEFGK